MRRLLKLIVLAVVVVVVGGGAALYWFVIRSDAKPRAHIEQTKVRAGGPLDGTWTLRPSDGRSFVGYRVQEQFAAATIESTATGRTGEVQGTLRVSGTSVAGVNVTANLATLKSDKSLRDQRLHTMGIETDKFPDATFALTQPIRLAKLPAEGETVDATAVGNLTLHGVTRPVSLPVQGRWDGQAVQVVGHLPVTFSDYRIDPPNIGGFTSVRDRGELELQLFFTR
jgi:polyisoprenoid-binding protein YceI